MHLFQDQKRFFKANLHCHTTLSDGRLSPAQATALYQDLGYDVLAITDHRILSAPTHKEGNMLLLSGIEEDYFLSGEVLHLVGLGLENDYSHARLPLTSPQAGIRCMQKHGGRILLAHPAWSLNTLSTLCSLSGISAAEIYNSSCSVPWEGNRADSSNLLDIAAAHGIPFPLVANDDTHHYEGEAGRSFTMIQAEELTQESLFTALDAGWFYASQGPAFEQISIEEDRISVRCSPVEYILFYSNRVSSRGRCIAKPEQTEGCYDLTQNPGETFVRCEIIDRQGLRAWSNPIMLAAT